MTRLETVLLLSLFFGWENNYYISDKGNQRFLTGLEACRGRVMVL